MSLKSLHMAKQLDDLEKMTVIPEVRDKKLLKLLDTANTVLREAEKYYRDGDEELAYVFFMRFFNLLNCIRKMPDYQQNKQTVRQKLGSIDALKLKMDKLESLTNSLTRRYEQLNGKPIIAPTISVDTISYDKLSASEKFDRLKAGTTSYPKSPTTTIIKPLNIVTCQELFMRMKDNNVLIIDCRPKADYELSHLTYKYAFNVPEEFIAAGMSAGKLQEKLDNSTKELWSARVVKDFVVLMDWNCKDGNPPEHTSISILRDILQNWDPDATYRSPIQILEGGYEYFILMYPIACTNPSVQAPQKIIENDDLMEDIEYPSLNDIVMKDEYRERGYSLSPESSFSSTSNIFSTRPSIDRSKKMVAIKTYEEKKKPIVDIKKEQEELHEKAQANDAQLEAASKKLADIINNKNKQELSTAEQELHYQIMQLESAAEDYKIENNTLRDELEKYKRLEREQLAALSAKEQANLNETAKEIETKFQERQRRDEELELAKQERERQLAIARELKRQMKQPLISSIQSSPDEQHEDVSVQAPQFDRSVKPQISPSPSYEVTPARQRDFSPISGKVGRGLTGLKNLGNTCYMNSILQCLSNTPQLTEYCITDKYKKYINRDNKTKGQIVEEVAALIKILWNGNYKCVASKDLRYVIGQYQQIFRGIEQQDSHEFLTILMDWLHSDLQTLPVSLKLRDNITASEKAWLEFTKSKESLILHLFYGQIKSTVKCVICSIESATYESFSNLSLELPSTGNVCDLEQCLTMYFSGELIHGWNCPNCKQKRDAVKKLNISKLPPVLVIHLKRFYADPDCVGSRNAYRKKQNYIRFPLDNLDMTPHIAKSESRSVTPKTYQLYSVSNHYGTMESGHYTAFCKSGNYARWFKFDDQVVTQLDTSNVVSSAAYILFYTWLPPIQINEIQ